MAAIGLIEPDPEGERAERTTGVVPSQGLREAVARGEIAASSPVEALNRCTLSPAAIARRSAAAERAVKRIG